MARWKKSLTAAVTVAAVCTVSSLLTGFVPADTDTVNAVDAAATIQQADLTDAQELVSAIAPEVAEEGNPSAEVAIEAGQEGHAADAVSPTAHLKSPTPGVNGISVSLDYATGTPSTSGDFSVMETSSPDAAAYVQPTSTGVRFLTAISSADAPSKYSYTFDVPADTELLETHGGYRLEPPTGASYGVLDAPWAKDSRGQSLPTSYRWEGNVLTQTVDLSNQDIAYPVLIDPAWGYSLDYSVGSTDAASAWSKLQKCFNCYFPIQGAPKAFPAYRQFLPLVVAFGPISGNFNCYMDITWRIASNIGYQFITAPGHVDGAGSNIAFEFYKNRGNQNRLSVTARVVNDFGVLNSGYLVGASNTWAQFAANIQTVKA